MIRFCRSLLPLFVALCSGSFLHAQSSTDTGTGTTTTTTTTTSTNGVLVYELNFEHLAGFNIDFWEGGFVVLPGTGGTGTVVLKGRNEIGGRIFRQFANSAYLFQAKRKNGRSSVLQMSGGTIGTSSPLVAMQAFGDVKGSISLDNPTFTLRVEVAKTMHGLAQASLDESLISATTTSTGTSTGSTTTTTTTVVNPLRPTDGTLGYAEFAEMKVVLDTSKTNEANKKGRALADEVTAVINDLKVKGYTDGTSTGSGGTGTGGTGTGGTGTGTGGTGTGGTGTGN